MRKGIVGLIIGASLGFAGVASAQRQRFTLIESRTVTVKSERAYWRGYPVKIAVPSCWWTRRGRFAKCRVLITGSFYDINGTPASAESIASTDDVAMRHRTLVAWTPN